MNVIGVDIREHTSQAWQYWLDPEARKVAKRAFLKFLEGERDCPRQGSLWSPAQVLYEIECVQHDLDTHDGYDCGCGG